MDELIIAYRGNLANFRTDSTEHMTPYEGSIVEEDRRLPMFGYTAETLNMLVLPMVKQK